MAVFGQNQQMKKPSNILSLPKLRGRWNRSKESIKCELDKDIVPMSILHIAKAFFLGNIAIHYFKMN